MPGSFPIRGSGFETYSLKKNHELRQPQNQETMIDVGTIYSPHFIGEDAESRGDQNLVPSGPESGSLSLHLHLAPLLPLPGARLEALQLWRVPDGISATGPRAPEDLAVGQSQAGSPSPHRCCGHRAEALSEESTCMKRPRMQ